MIRENWVHFIVEKDKQYVRNGPLLPMYGKKSLIMTPYAYDAKRFRSYNVAAKIAGNIEGKVRTFDALNGEVN